MKRTLMKVAAALASTFGMVAASQAAIVTQWEYDLDSQWIAFTATGVGGGGPVIDMAGNNLRWGVPANPGNLQSRLFITDPAANQTVDTFIGGGAPPQVAPFLGQGSMLTHFNNVISLAGQSLTSATLRSTLNLEALMPPMPGVPGVLPPINFDISFTETPNQAPCVVAGSPVPCNDIFVLTDGFFNQAFSLPGDPQTYFINIFPVAGGVLQTLSNAECAAAGAAANCLGFTTVEGQANNITFGFTISTERLSIPEPGTLALAGLALLGAGALRRRVRR